MQDRPDWEEPSDEEPTQDESIEPVESSSEEAFSKPEEDSELQPPTSEQSESISTHSTPDPLVTSSSLAWTPSGDESSGVGYSPTSAFGYETYTEDPFEEEEEPRSKPFLARVLNKIGIRTGAGADWLLDWIQVLAVAALLAWLTMSYVVVRMRVPTGSMEPTIASGSSFFVDKMSFYIREPNPGDIIVFWHNETDDKRVRYVKRLVATEGQQVNIVDCIKNDQETCGVFVNGQKMTGPAFTAPDGRPRQYYANGRMGDDTWTVPEDHYFVLGDNSRNSLDSRFWGYVHQDDFIGEPFLRVWPLNEFGFMNGYFGIGR